jgi:4-amino-4-deoxy-L-arabinose transferase-like glycosyltransferase
MKNWMRSPSVRRLIIIAVIVIGLTVRLFIVIRDLDILDRLFVPDDTYYTLSIARSMANNLGPSADGVQLTNGFQPLLAFLMVPVFSITDNPDISLRAVLVLAGLFGLANALLLGRLAFRMAGYGGALAASIMWSFSPAAIATSFDGLETSLALTISLALVEVWTRASEKGTKLNYIAAGILAGLALLARVDTVFLVGLLGLLEFIRGNRKGLLVTVLVAAVVVSPWWIYSLSHFSTFIPESGAAVKTQLEFHQSLYLNEPKQAAWAAGTIIGGPFFETQNFREYLFTHPILGSLTALALLLIYLASIRWIYRKKNRPRAWLAFALHGMLIALFYTFYLPALWFFDRYLHQTIAAVTLVIAILMAELWRQRLKCRIAWPGLSVFSMFVAYGLFQSGLFIWINPPTTLDVSLHGAKGYREVARDVLKIVPESAVLGAFQSGALAFYGWPRTRVVNLDGVIDGKAAQAIRERNLGEYARSRDLTHFADWPFNYNAFRFFGGPAVARAEFQIIGQARPQGLDRTIISRVIWR